MLQDRESMRVPLIGFHWCEAVAEPKVVQVLMEVGDDASEIRLGTGVTILEALERLVEDIRLHATIADDQRMRKILGGTQ